MTRTQSWNGADRYAALRWSYAGVAPFVTLAGLMVLASVAILVKGRGLTFFYDEWAWVMRRRDWNVGVFLEPHNEHLSLLPVTVFKLLFATVGLSHYGVYRVVGLLFHLTCVTLVFLLVRRRVGDWLGVALASLVLFLGMAWNDLLAPFQIGFLGSIAAGLAMLLVFERTGRRGDIAACVLLIVSLSSSGLGILFVVAAFVELLWARTAGARFGSWCCRSFSTACGTSTTDTRTRCARTFPRSRPTRRRPLRERPRRCSGSLTSGGCRSSSCWSWWAPCAWRERR